MPDHNLASLTLGVARHPSVLALIDGTVKAEGIDLTCVYDFPQPSVVVRHNRIIDGQLDGGEICLAMYAGAKARGGPFVGIPVYLLRSFRHRSIYCRDGAGIETPADLKGKRVGLLLYSAATMVWARGILRDEFGVQPQDLRWYALMNEGVDQARRTGVQVDTIPVPSPGGNVHEHIARLVESGELDAAIGPVNITRPGISRLFPDFAEAEADYYRRTGIFPIIHPVVINERVVHEHPWVPGSLLEAFRRSAELTTHYAAQGHLEPSDREVWEVDRRILAGEDPYCCGIGEKDARTLERFLDFLVLDGVIGVKPSLDLLFPYR